MKPVTVVALVVVASGCVIRRPPVLPPPPHPMTVAAPIYQPSTQAPPPPAVGFEGYGEVRYGATRDAVETALGHPLQGDDETGCHTLTPQRTDDVQFMFTDGKLRRIEVESPETAAEGGGRVGMHADEIRMLYADRVTELPSQYAGLYLVVSAPQDLDTELVFAVDPEGRVTRFRAGLQPYVEWVEGCS